MIGRIYDLRVSTNDRNLEIKGGVFSGRKWALMILILEVNEIIRRADQMGLPQLKVIKRWDVMVVE